MFFKWSLFLIPGKTSVRYELFNLHFYLELLCYLLVDFFKSTFPVLSLCYSVVSLFHSANFRSFILFLFKSTFLFFIFFILRILIFKNVPLWLSPLVLYSPVCMCMMCMCLHTVCVLASSSSQRFIFYGNLASPDLWNYFYIVATYLLYLGL